jgi:hypothetical protein
MLEMRGVKLLPRRALSVRAYALRTAKADEVFMARFSQPKGLFHGYGLAAESAFGASWHLRDSFS